jgi:hypothetical protein
LRAERLSGPVERAGRTSGACDGIGQNHRQSDAFRTKRKAFFYPKGGKFYLAENKLFGLEVLSMIS